MGALGESSGDHIHTSAGSGDLKPALRIQTYRMDLAGRRVGRKAFQVRTDDEGEEVEEGSDQA